MHFLRISPVARRITGVSFNNEAKYETASHRYRLLFERYYDIRICRLHAQFSSAAYNRRDRCRNQTIVPWLASEDRRASRENSSAGYGRTDASGTRRTCSDEQKRLSAERTTHRDEQGTLRCCASRRANASESAVGVVRSATISSWQQEAMVG